MNTIQKKINTNKYVYQSMMQVYGINKSTCHKMLGVLAVRKNSPNGSLIKGRVKNKLIPILPLLNIRFKLKLITFSRIVLLIYRKTYRGMRHIQGLPTRGQRTKANGKTPKNLKATGKNLPFKLKKKNISQFNKLNEKKKFQKQKKKIKLSKKQKGKLKAKQKVMKKAKKKK